MSLRRYVIGLDEAGYGPNIGPLVIAATVWSLPASLHTEDLWMLLEDVLTNSPERGDARLHVGDSKQVYRSGAGLGSLERSVLGFSPAPETSPEAFETWSQLLIRLQGHLPETFARQPWYQGEELQLPRAAKAEVVRQHRHLLQQALLRADIRLETMAVEVVCPERFNREVSSRGNKGALLSHATFGLLRRVWPRDCESVEVLADKHGGRNRYDDFLLEYFPDDFYLREKESLEESRYRRGKISFAFAMQSERHLPVALASMIAKYLRELCLELFNAYWSARKPGLRETKGYPQDAVRFRHDISDLLAESPELLAVLWRDR